MIPRRVGLLLAATALFISAAAAVERRGRSDNGTDSSEKVQTFTYSTTLLEFSMWEPEGLVFREFVFAYYSIFKTTKKIKSGLSRIFRYFSKDGSRVTLLF